MLAARTASTRPPVICHNIALAGEISRRVKRTLRQKGGCDAVGGWNVSTPYVDTRGKRRFECESICGFSVFGMSCDVEDLAGLCLFFSRCKDVGYSSIRSPCDAITTRRGRAGGSESSFHLSPDELHLFHNVARIGLHADRNHYRLLFTNMMNSVQWMEKSSSGYTTAVYLTLRIEQKLRSQARCQLGGHDCERRVY